MNITVRRLNEHGIENFRSYLSGLAEGSTDTPPTHLLADDEYSDALPETSTVDPAGTFLNKMEFSQYLVDRLAPVRSDPAMDRHVGFWSWLALCFFDQICPPKNDGTRTPGAVHRFILSKDYKHHYRHLIRTPCLAYDIHGENARPLLASNTHQHGEASEQLLSRQHLFGNKALFEALNKLYVSEKGTEWRVKRGARGSGGGSMRRIGKVLKQFDLTYDLHAMTGQQIYEMLPAEFERFKKAS